MGKQWKQWQTVFLGSKITADGDCSHDFKRCLLFGRKAVTNLDSILKKQRHHFADKGRYSQSYGFSPVVMYRCESWRIKKAECQRIDAFEPWCWRRLLRVSWTARRSSQSILKKINPEYSLGGQMLKLKPQYFVHWCKEPAHWEIPRWREGLRREEKGTTEDEMVGWHHQLNGHEFELTLGHGDG